MRKENKEIAHAAKTSEPVVWMQSDHLGKFIHHACGSQSILARCSDEQLMQDYKPLFLHPAHDDTEPVTATNIEFAVARACKEPSLLDALSWICGWESERIVKQVRENYGSGANGAGWDACFKFCLKQVIDKYPATDDTALLKQAMEDLEDSNGVNADDMGLPTREHITDGTPCWCNPETTYIDPETGLSVIVHREPQ